MSRYECPTLEQIRAIFDAPALQHIADEIERQIAKITADLRMDDKSSKDWTHRAHHAREHLRIALRQTERQLRVVNHDENQRKESDNDPRTNALMKGEFVVRASALNTEAELAKAEEQIAEHLGALALDRGDEISRPGIERDEGWLMLSLAAQKRAGSWRSDLQRRRTALREAAHAELNASLPQKFIDAARAMLPAETMKAIWDRARTL